MFWEYSRKETKLLLVATLLLFSAFSIKIGQSWMSVYVDYNVLPANSVGVYAGVEENSINTLVAQLDTRERELDAREKTIMQAEQMGDDTRVLFLISLVGVGLFGLILLNFYLDSKRRLSLAP